MAKQRARPRIYVSWLRNYLYGEHVCKWSLWYRIHFLFEQTDSDFDSVNYKINHTRLRNKVANELTKDGWHVRPEIRIFISGSIADMKGSVDLVATKNGRCRVYEMKTGQPRSVDKVQLLLYIWSLPRMYPRYKNMLIEGVLVYSTHQLEVSALDVNEEFCESLSDLIKEMLGPEPDSKNPHPDECKWCKVAECDERLDMGDVEKSEYVPDFF